MSQPADQPILSSQSLADVKRFAEKLPQTVIMSVMDFEWGEQIAKYLAQLAGYDYEVVYPETKEEIDLEKGKINVKQARELVLKTRTALKKNKIYIIYKASTMNEQAQNAFLKNLEEPNSSTFFILLVDNLHSLLPTVISRAQSLKISPISNEQSLQLIPSNIEPTIKQQILFVANGNPVVIAKLVNDSALIEKYSKHITIAKELLTANDYQKIIIINKLKESREDAVATMEALVKIINTTIKSPDTKLLRLLNSALDARNDLKANFNVRLTIMHHLI